MIWRLLLPTLFVLPTPSLAQATSPPTVPADASPAYDVAAFDRCLDRLQQQFASKGVENAVFDRNVRAIVPDTSVLKQLDNQPEFKTPVWDYLAGLVDAERVTDGQAMLRQHAATLAKVEAQYGVDPATVVAIWGVESDFGKTSGSRPLLNSLTTLSCMGRRQEFFRGELAATLQIIQSGDIAADALVGSWAGAFGQTQFMPSTYQRIAVDFDGDGRRDLVGTIPDALASTANYLERSHWRTGQPWGYEVKLPGGFDTAISGRTTRRPLSYWTGRGISRVDGGAIAPSDTATALLLPAGKAGPAFLVFKNFDAIYSYNASESYSLAIALLSDRLRGQGGLVASWPTADPGLSRRQRRELQQLLLQRGHDIGEVDGLIGSATRSAIKIEQQGLGVVTDGRASQSLLQALQAPIKGAKSGPTGPADPPRSD
ncbi:lytic murein transglycosylase [Lysobacter sp. A286]